MGRKIPGKKHKGVKDPEKQQAVRYSSIKDKINCPPSNPDEQAIPKSLKKIMNFKQRSATDPISTKRVKRKSKSLISTESNRSIKKLKMKTKRLRKPDKPPANFTQLPGESQRAFMCRINQTVNEYLKETQFENKFGVNIKRHEETGEVIGIEKKPKDEFEEMMKKAKRKKGKKKITNEPKLSKAEKRKLKLAQKKEKRELERIDEFDQFKDKIKFGETVHAPPSLPTPRRASKTNTVSRPGKKDLLLKKNLTQSAPASSSRPAPASKRTVYDKVQSSEKKSVDKKGKRKDLPLFVRQQLEKEQKQIIASYRNIKARRLEET